MSNIPRFQGEDRMPERDAGRQAPPSVMTAVRFMYVGAVLSAITMVVGLATAGSLRGVIHKALPADTSAQLTMAVRFQVIDIVIGGLIGIALWLWMASANRRGRNWARVTGTVFFGIETIVLLVANTVLHEDALSLLVSILVWAVGMGAVAFLWKPSSSAYFKASKYPS